MPDHGKKMGVARTRILTTAWHKVRQSEMDDGSEADLKIILRIGIKPGVDVIGFGAKRNARVISPIRAAASLQGETILALTGDLGIQVHAASKHVSPRCKALAGNSQIETATARVENVFGALA